MDKKSQCQKLLDYMKSKPVSSYAAVVELGITSLHRRLSDLRAQGCVIADEWTESNNKRFKIYRLVEISSNA